MYTRGTELRTLKSDDLFTLFAILDDNQFWKKLMVIMPKGCDFEKLAAKAGRHYNHFHVSLLESALNTLYGKVFSELGKGVTLGFFYELLVSEQMYCGLYEPVEYVGNYLLNIGSPPRPANGPAPIIEITPWDQPLYPTKRWQKPKDKRLYVNNDLQRLLEEEKDNIQKLSAHIYCIF